MSRCRVRRDHLQVSFLLIGVATLLTGTSDRSKGGPLMLVSEEI